MNTTQAYVYIGKKGPHHLVIVWERADIECMNDNMNFVFVGTCHYDIEMATIIEWERR